MQGGATEKEEQIRSTLKKLDDALVSSSTLSTDDIAALRKQLDESQAYASEQQERLRHQAEETELLTRQKDELEARLTTLEQDYEELLDRTLHEEQAQDLTAEGAHELRVRDARVFFFPADSPSSDAAVSSLVRGAESAIHFRPNLRPSMLPSAMQLPVRLSTSSSRSTSSLRRTRTSLSPSNH